MSARVRLALLAVAAALLVALAIAVIAGGPADRSSPTNPSSNPPAGSGFDGAALPAGPPARDFTLTDQSGRSVSLRDFRGRVTILAFLYSTCRSACVLIAQQIRGALDELRHPIPVLIVSADPSADTPASVRRFLAQMSLSGRVEYLTAPLARLRPVWAAYGIVPATRGRAAFDRYASVLLLDRRGSPRVLFESEQLTPEALSHDIGRLGGG
jgi:protein SCO1/2